MPRHEIDTQFYIIIRSTRKERIKFICYNDSCTKSRVTESSAGLSHFIFLLEI